MCVLPGFVQSINYLIPLGGRTVAWTWVGEVRVFSKPHPDTVEYFLSEHSSEDRPESRNQLLANPHAGSAGNPLYNTAMPVFILTNIYLHKEVYSFTR